MIARYSTEDTLDQGDAPTPAGRAGIVTPFRRKPIADDSMSVTTADGPVASVPPPMPSPAGPQLQAPTSPATSPLISAGMSAIKPPTAGPTPTPIATAPPAMAPAPPEPTAPAVAPAPIPFAPPSAPTPSPVPAAPPAVAPSTPVPPIAAPTPINFAPPPTQTSPLVQTSALTGDEVPVAIQPTQSAGLSALLAKAQAAASGALDAPTIWDDPLAQQIKDQQKRGIDENFTGQQDALDAELASKGLDYSSIAGSRNLSLATRKAQALSDVDTNIARERADSLAAGRAGALAGANATAGQGAALESNYRTEARGERNYVDTTRNKAQQDAITQTVLSSQLGNENFNNILNLVRTGMGYGQNGANLMGAAGAGYGYAGSQYGQQADAGNAQLGDLASLAMQLFGGSSGGTGAAGGSSGGGVDLGAILNLATSLFGGGG